jgi:hypothetical protein
LATVHDAVNLIKSLLESQGYTALAAHTPGEAIEIAEGYSGEIHLILADVDECSRMLNSLIRKLRA